MSLPILVLIDPSLEREGITTGVLLDAIREELRQEGIEGLFLHEARVAPKTAADLIAQEIQFADPLLRDVELVNISLGGFPTLLARRREIQIFPFSELPPEVLGDYGLEEFIEA